MSLQDRLGTQDATQLLTLASGLALATAAGGTTWSYNLPLMLFGVIAHDLPSSTGPLRHFISLCVFSAIFDLLSLFSAGFGFTFLFALVLLVLKAPIVATSIAVLKERGGEYSGFGGFRGLPQMGGSAGGQQSNWVPSMPAMPAMPGGFGGAQAQQPSQAPPPSFPSSGGFRLGGEEDEQGAPPPAPAPGRNGYSSIA